MPWRNLSVFLLATLPILTFARSATAEESPPKLLGSVTASQLAEPPFSEWFDRGQAEYVPDPGVVETLRRADWRDVEVTIFFGTWCEDSQREVPRMLELLDTLRFPPSDRRLIAVDNAEELHKRSPGGEEEGLEIYRVPTLIVERGGREVARIVEHPARSLERDLLTIVEGEEYTPSYASYPTIRHWLREGLLAEANVNADGLAGEVRTLVSSEWELYSAARVLTFRGERKEGAKLMEVNCSIYWESSWCHARLADLQIRAGEVKLARRSVVRALERNDDPDEIEALVELVDRTARSPAESHDVATLENELRAAETAFANAFAEGDMEAFTQFVAEEAVFFSGAEPLRGRAAIVEAWTHLRGEGEAPPFTWEPERVAVEAKGIHGLSTGPVYSPDGQWIATFVSTRKRTAEGWQVLLDTGPRCPPPQP